MKYLKKYNESESANFLRIEDMLLEFQDTGDIISYYLSENDDSFYLDLDFNEDLIGINKLRVIDKIIKRITQKYQYILILNDALYFSDYSLALYYKPKESFKMLNWIFHQESFESSIDSILKEKFSNLTKYDKPDLIKYKRYNTLVLKYWLDDNFLVVNQDYFVAVFKGKYLLTSVDILALIMSAAAKYLSIYVIKCDCSNDF